MSLLNKASLIQIPSGYKDGTLYSAKPTNGDGDFTFSRGSNLAATRVNSDGLIEKGRENLLLQSNSFDTTWTKSNASVTSGQSGYDGSSDAWLLESSTNGSAYIQQTSTQSGVQTFSFYAKAGTTDWVRVIGASSPDYLAFYDLTNGVVGTTLGSANIDTSIQSVGGGWYRCSISGNATISRIILNVAEADNDILVSIGDNIYIQDSQLESGLVATEYIETGASTAQTGILEDMPRLDYSGGATCGSLLLEPSRTQLVTQSEYFGAWNNARTIDTDNQATSPEGVVNAAYLEQQSGQTNAGSIYFGVTFPSTSDYTTSIFAKKGEKDFIVAYDKNTDRTYFNLDTGTVGTTPSGVTASIEDFGNGWYRCSATFNTAAGGGNIAWYLGDTDNSSTVTDSGGVYIYGAMLEAGSYVSSYIPTYGASVTRGADELDLTNWVSKGIISDSNEWTIFYEFDGLTNDYDTGDSQWLRGQDGTIDVYMRAGATSENFARFYWRKDSKYIGSTYGKKIIARLSGGTGTTFADGVEIASSSISGDYSNIGLDMGSSNAAGYVKQAIIFPTALTDAECEQLTTI